MKFTKNQQWVLVAFLIVGFVAYQQYQVLPKQQQPLSVLYVPLALASGQSSVTIGVNQGQGTICADDHTSGVKQCTKTNYNLPVSEGDSVTFTATADQGYAFAQFIGPGGISATDNPLTVTIVQQQGATGFVKADFAQCSSGNACTLVVTSTPTYAATSTTSTAIGTQSSTVTNSWPTLPNTGQGTAGWLTATSYGVPNWFLVILGIAILALLLRLLRR